MNDPNYKDCVSRFLRETCCFSELAHVPVNELFEIFKIWCAKSNLHPRMVHNFSTAVVSHKGVFFDIQQHGGVIRRVFIGVSSDKRMCNAA